MNISRRHFIGAALATGAVSPAEVSARTTDKIRLRIGVLSDIHIEGPNARSVDKFERALRYFDRRKADGVLISGDLADNGVEPQLRRLAEIWEKVFPGGRRSDGEPVTRLFHYGDHDTGGYAHTNDFFHSHDNLKRVYNATDEQIASWVIADHRAEIWERVFGERFEPIVLKTVKGYDFILAHWTKQGNDSLGGCATPGLEEFFRTHVKNNGGRPFFYSQHRIPRDTACGSGTWGQDAGRDNSVFARYSNLLVFCGHGHKNAFADNSFWQGSFACVETPSLNYVGQNDHGEHKWGPKVNENAAEQGLFMTVTDKMLFLERRDLKSGRSLGDTWRVPLAANGSFAAKPYAPYERIRHARIPQFATGSVAHLTADAKDNALALSFPSVPASRDSPRAYDYKVTVDSHRFFGGNVERQEFYVFSPHCIDAADDDVCEIVCKIPYAALEVNGKKPIHVHVSVRPRGCDEQLGLPIEAECDV